MAIGIANARMEGNSSIHNTETSIPLCLCQMPARLVLKNRIGVFVSNVVLFSEVRPKQPLEKFNVFTIQ